MELFSKKTSTKRMDEVKQLLIPFGWK